MRFFKRWGAVVLWCTLIFFLSSQPSIKVSEKHLVNFLFFKGLHIFEYAILYGFWVRGLTRSKKLEVPTQSVEDPRPPVGTRDRKAFGLTVLYAISDEIHQLFVPTREGRIRDVFIDGLGGLLGWWLIKYLLPNLPPKLKNWASSLLSV